MGQLETPAGEEGAGPDKQGIGPLVRQSGEYPIDLAGGACTNDEDLQPHRVSRRLDIFQYPLGIAVGRINEHGNPSDARHQLPEKVETLRR